MSKVVQPNSIDFNSLSCPSSVLGEALSIQDRLAAYRNPYVGNKRKIFAPMIDFLDKSNIEYNSVIDLFCGSGYVGLGMAWMGKKVLFNDIMNWCWANAWTIACNEYTKFNESDISYLCNNYNNNARTFVQDNYSDRFTKGEAIFLDNYHANVLSMPRNSAGVSLGVYRLAITGIIHYVLENCFVGGRLNSGQVLAKLEHRIKHARNKNQEMKFQNIVYHPCQIMKQKPRAQSMDAIAMLKEKEFSGKYDLVYIDPPYGSAQSDYSFMYSFCEEYFCGDKLENLPRLAAAKKFVGKKDYEEHFNELLSASLPYPSILISYNDSSWAKIEKIIDIVKKYRKEVTIESVNYNYNYRDQGTSETSKEFFILAK